MTRIAAHTRPALLAVALCAMHGATASAPGQLLILGEGVRLRVSRGRWERLVRTLGVEG